MSSLGVCIEVSDDCYCFSFCIVPSFSYSEPLFYPIMDGSDSMFSLGVISYFNGEYGIVCDEGVSNETKQLLCNNISKSLTIIIVMVLYTFYV